MFFANLPGLFALLALPVILAIHFLQERSRKIKVSTLFLLERLRPESVEGARWERLRNSVPLWMQILAVLLIAWILSEPRWIKEDSHQSIAVVLDSSMSMSAFKEDTRLLLADRLSHWSQHAHRTDWYLLASDPRKPTLYVGQDLKGLLSSLDKWEPTLGTHAPDDALLTGRSLVKNFNGVVVFVTDHKADVASDIAVLSAGRPIENVGFAGVTVNVPSATANLQWKALIKNYGHQAQQRDWWIEGPSAPKDGVPEKHHLVIEPGQTQSIEGTFSSAIERATLVLDGDQFTWDDRLPILRPHLRKLLVDLRLGGAAGDIMRKMFGAISNVEFVSGSASGKPETHPDLVISEIGTASETDAVQLAGGSPSAELDPLEGTPTVAEDHPLTRDLNWLGLITTKPSDLTLGQGDEPLLWKGDRPLAFLRMSKGPKGATLHRLLLNWDFEHSNAARTPAVLVMLQRFANEVRNRKDEPWADNFEISETLSPFLGVRGSGKAPTYSLLADNVDQPFEGRAPEKPGFFLLRRDRQDFLTGAAHFADTRQADFSHAEPVDTLQARAADAAFRQSESDPLTPLWFACIAACLLLAWAWKTRRRPSHATPSLLTQGIME